MKCNYNMKKNVTYKEKFTKLFLSIASKYGKMAVWNDFIVMYACFTSSVLDRRFYEKRQKMYHDIAKRYTKEETNAMRQMYNLLSWALTEYPDRDFLGEIYAEFCLNDRTGGQVFTPSNVASLMADFNLESISENDDEQDTVVIQDPCCGSGALLIAFVNEALKANINYQTKNDFIAQDRDYIAALMCYIQLSLHGCRAIVKVGDYNTQPFVDEDMNSEDVWLTPMYIDGDFIRLAYIAHEAGYFEN